MFRKPKWEYHQITVPKDKVSQSLDDLGQGGWEAYAAFPQPPAPRAYNTDYPTVIMLKRKC